MDHHQFILQNILNNNFLDEVDEGFSLLSEFVYLLEQGYISASDESTMLGRLYRDPEINRSGIEYLNRLKDMNNTTPNTIGVGYISDIGCYEGSGNMFRLATSIQQLAEYIVQSEDEEAKFKFKELLENHTVARFLGEAGTVLLKCV